MTAGTIPDQFVPLYVRYRRDRAIRAAGCQAEGLYLRALAHSKANRTNGILEDFDVNELGDDFAALTGTTADELAEKLVEVGLWLQLDEPGRWRIAAWEKWNGDDEARADRVTDGKRGAHVRYHMNRGKTDPACPFCSQATTPQVATSSPLVAPYATPSEPYAAPTGDASEQGRMNCADDSTRSGGVKRGTRVIAGDTAPTSPPTGGVASAPIADGEGEGDREGDTTTIPSTLRAEGTDSRDDDSPAACTRRATADYDQPGFSDFWQVYPRKIDKRAAAKAYRAAVKRGATPGQLTAAATAYAAQRADQDPAYTKHAKTWLGADAWLNEAEPQRDEAARTTRPSAGLTADQWTAALIRAQGITVRPGDPMTDPERRDDALVIAGQLEAR